MINWEDEDIKEWMKNAKQRQQHFCDSLGDREYDHFSSDQITLFEVKIAYAFFGPPHDENQNESENTELLSVENTEMLSVENYSTEQKEWTVKVKDKIIEIVGNEDINVAFLFVILKQDENQHQVPLIRIIKGDESVIFIDNILRVYDNWDDYVVNNELPQCICCYPEKGFYRFDDEGEVLVQFETSPRCNLGERVVNVADITSLVATGASLALLGGSFLFPFIAPIAAPIATYTGVSAGGYNVARSTYKIYDRTKHDQTINPLTDGAARGIWLGAVGGALGLGSMGVTSYISRLAARGDIARKFIRVTYTVLGASNLTVNGIGVVSNLFEMIHKKSKGDEITTWEVLNFGISVFFFTNSCMSFKTAKALIRDVQINVIDNYGKNLPDDSSETFKIFRDKAVLNTKVRPNARFIKNINQIDNPAEFWSCLSNAGDGHNIKFHRTNFGQITINKELVIHANKLTELKLNNPGAVSDIFKCTNRLMNDGSYATQFLEDVKHIEKQERISFEISRRQTLNKLRETLGVKNLKDYKVGGRPIFHKMDPHAIDRIGTVMESCKVQGDKELLHAIKTFAEKTNCTNSSDFIACIEIINKNKSELAKTLIDIPRKERSAHIVEQLNDPNSGLMNKFCSDYDTIFAKVSNLNATADQPFKTDNLATYHFVKHGNFEGRELEPEEYFDQIKKLFNDNFNSENWKPKLSQDGQNLLYQCHAENGMFGVFVQPLVKTDLYCCFTATVFYMPMKSFDKKNV